MMLLRGKGTALEIVCLERELEDVTAELRARLNERPEFYRGSRASALFGRALPTSAALGDLRALLAEFEIELAAVHGEPALDPVAAGAGIPYAGPVPHAEVAPLPARRPRSARATHLSEAARSLVADFAGARADLAARRGPQDGGAPAPVPAPLRAALESTTLYHRGTLRGGQALRHPGNIVVIGDVNPGGELVAGGDIAVFGSLRGVAHAGAQGDASARVIALDLCPTQLRIANMIAADVAPVRTAGPEYAFAENGRIAIAPHAHNIPAVREGAR